MSDTRDDLPPRVAVLEEIARTMNTGLEGLRADIRDLRQTQHEDFRLTIRLFVGVSASMAAGVAALLAVMAHGFHWI